MADRREVTFDAATLERLKGVLHVDEHGKRLDLQDRRLAVLEAQDAAEPWHGKGGPSLLDFLGPAVGHGPTGGIVLDEAVAREPRACLGIALDPARPDHAELVFKHGIAGALSEAERAQYCETTVVRQPSPAQRARVEDFRAAAAACEPTVRELPKGERGEPYLVCMQAHLRSRGRSISGAPLVPTEEPAAGETAEAG